MYDLFRESALGQAIRFVSRNKWLQYPEERPDFVLPPDVEASELGLALYVLAYGVGPLIFGPLTEIPAIGRNPVYYLTFIVFFAFSFPAATINSFGGLLAVRFFAGFFGSVGIAIGGASIGDVFTLLYFPYGLGWWVLSFWAGPAIGPTFAGFAAMTKGWRWPLWEVVWICAIMAIFLLALTPETSSSNILLRRAKRLRKLTGDERLQSQSEIDQKHMTGSDVLIAALIRPFEITIKDPSIFFVNLYTALTYAIYFTFFEVFPLVFPPFYGFNLGQTGLAFLACEVGSILALILYFAYLHFYMIPDNIKNGFREQEHRLLPAIFGSVVLPVGLFIFAWTARASIHWIVPLIGVAIFVLGQYMVIQGLFMYVPVSYPQYAASIFTGNDLIRSAVATGCILAARPMFINLGVHKGVTVLAGLSIMGIIGTLLMYKYGKRLRAKSKFAQN
ncbi:hypothetical protein TrVFT333_006015 [Trichoderma virens FT-333]|nr:hypothetical protein TrVFT333_006015 [Trichoderma virens FT-333]